MQYTLFIYLDQKEFSRRPTDEQNRVHRECGAWHEELVRSGNTRSATGLQPLVAPTTVRSHDGKIVVMDGPFIETKEVLGGYENIVCRDLDEAIAIAKRFPGLQAGCTVEIRPEVIGNNCEA